MNELSRRHLMQLTVAGACAACLAPDAAADEPAAGGGKAVAIGKLADYPKAGFYDGQLAAHKLLVARLDDRLVAMTAVCTHKRCTVQPQGADALRCPCHGATYSEQGTPLKGPAKVALSRYAVRQGDDGTITVDLGKSFAERDWDDAAAFVPIAADAK